MRAHKNGGAPQRWRRKSEEQNEAFLKFRTSPAGDRRAKKKSASSSSSSSSRSPPEGSHARAVAADHPAGTTPASPPPPLVRLYRGGGSGSGVGGGKRRGAGGPQGAREAPPLPRHSRVGLGDCVGGLGAVGGLGGVGSVGGLGSVGRGGAKSSPSEGEEQRHDRVRADWPTAAATTATTATTTTQMEEMEEMEKMEMEDTTRRTQVMPSSMMRAAVVTSRVTQVAQVAIGSLLGGSGWARGAAGAPSAQQPPARGVGGGPFDFDLDFDRRKENNRPTSTIAGGAVVRSDVSAEPGTGRVVNKAAVTAGGAGGAAAAARGLRPLSAGMVEARGASSRGAARRSRDDDTHRGGDARSDGGGLRCRSEMMAMMTGVTGYSSSSDPSCPAVRMDQGCCFSLGVVGRAAPRPPAAAGAAGAVLAPAASRGSDDSTAARPPSLRLPATPTAGSCATAAAAAAAAAAETDGTACERLDLRSDEVTS